MGLTTTQKTHISKMIRSHSIDNIYHSDFVDIIGKRNINDLDIINYLCDYIINILDSSKETSINLLDKHLNIINLYINSWYPDIVDFTIVEKLNYIKNNYKIYCSNLKIDENSHILESIKKFDETINKFEHTNQNEELAKLNETINALKKELNNYKEKIKNYEKNQSEFDQKQSNLQNLFDKKTKKSEEQKKEITTLSNKIKELETLLNEKEQLISDLNTKLRVLPKKEYEKKISKLEEEKNKQKQEIENLNILINNLNKENKNQIKTIKNYENLIEKKSSYIEAYELEKRNKLEKINREKAIQDFVLEGLLENNLTINELIALSKDKNLNIELEELREILKKLKTKFTITNPNISYIEQKYSICTPKLQTNKSIFIEASENQYMDLLVVSDFHIEKYTNLLRKKYERIYDYCAENNINYILNLGDLFDNKYHEKTLDNLKINLTSYDNFIKFFPKDSNIKHIILGGNHDIGISSFGIDPIDYISDNRSDIINLGYECATIAFDNDNLMLHHIDKRFEMPYNKENIISQDINAELENIYRKLAKNRDETYIDLLGHCHYSRLDPINSYCIVPSYTSDHNHEGAWHLRIYFNKDKQIEYIIFIPLILKNKLKPISEILYKKKKSIF